MELYPGRVYSKPEFTALPPYLFSGADFALIPSRDEPFGLVAVEFGRKGALGVGSRLGGLGLMPGWVCASPGKSMRLFADVRLIVVPSRIYFDGAHVVSVQEDDQESSQVYPEGAAITACSLGCPAFPCRGVASTDGGFPQEEYQRQSSTCRTGRLEEDGRRCWRNFADSAC